MNPTHYLRVESVNLYRVLADTHDLSTARGAGLLQLQAIRFAWLELGEVAGVSNVKSISQGASIGLFSFELEEKASPESVRQSVEEALRRDGKYRFFTFVVDVVVATGSFRLIVETLVAMNRARQLREASVAIPSWNEDGDIWPDEKFDRVAPADVSVEVPDDDNPGKMKVVAASQSVAVRRGHGREQRKELYEDLGVTREKLDSFFTDDLATLTQGAPKGSGHLDEKMAVFYTDGNSFSSIARKCEEPGELTAFDKTIQDSRKAMLAALLAKMDALKPDARWWTKPERGAHKGKDCRRLETLLWGADELIFVVPAWAGWELASWFFKHTEKWKHGDADLTHAAGLVFSSHRAPIQRVIALAKNLAQLAKDTIKKQDIKERARNLLGYEVLESFDHIGSDLAANWRCRLKGSGLKESDLLLRGAVLEEFSKSVATLERDGFPQRQLHAQAKDTLNGSAWATTAGHKSLEKWKPTLDSIAAQLKPCPEQAAWVHLAQLWNYSAIPAV